MEKQSIDTKKEFAGRLSSLRIKKEISARELSLSLGMSPNYINHIESGEVFPSMGMFLEICELLEISPFEFFEYSKDSPKDFSLEMGLLEKRLTDQDKALLIQLAGHLSSGNL